MSDIAKYRREIQGWCDFGEFYQEIVEKAPKDSVFIEVGCWKGQSTAILMDAILKSKKNIKLYVVDTFSGQKEYGEQMNYIKLGENIFQIFWTNMQKYGFHHHIIPVVCNSAWCLDYIKEKEIDFIFLDGDFSEKYILKDLEYLYPAVKKGGTFAGRAHGFKAQEVVRSFFKSKNIPVLHSGHEVWEVQKPS